jgi:4-amino-4-deoxy-L-arabinose transferase-like glycosyltransferase
VCAVDRPSPVTEVTPGPSVPASSRRAPVERLGGFLARRDVQLIAAITAGAGVLRFASLGAQSLWYDESVTASLVAQPLGAMLRSLRESETAPPLYYVLAWIWTRLFGSSDLALRSLSAAAGTLTVPVLYAAAKALVSRRAGIITAALAACSPLLVWYSQEARAYSLLVLLSSLSVLAFALLWQAPASKHVAWWAMVSCLAVATYYYAAFLVLAEAALLLGRHRRNRRLALGTAAIVVTSAMLLPLAVLQARTGNAAWIHSLPLSGRVEEAIRQLVTPAPAPLYAGGGTAAQHTRYLWITAALVLAVAVVAALRYGSSIERRGALLAGALAATVFAMPLVLSVLAPLMFDERSDTFLYRALLPAWGPVAIVLATGFGALRVWGLGLAASVVLVAASLAVTLAIAIDGRLQRDDLQAAGSATQGKGLILVLPAFERHPLLRYRPDLQAAPTDGVETREIELLVRASRRSNAVFRPPRAFRLVDKRRIQHFMLQRFRSSKEVRLTAGELAALAEEGYGLISPREGSQPSER